MRAIQASGGLLTREESFDEEMGTESCLLAKNPIEAVMEE